MLDLIPSLLLVLATGILAILAAGVLTRESDPRVRQRLAAIAPGRPAPAGGGPGAASAATSWLAPARWPALARAALRVAPAFLRGQRLKARLASAGFIGPRAVANLALAQMLAALATAAALGLLGLARRDPGTLAFTLVGAVVGYQLPGLWLSRRIDRRRREIRLGLPDALDLMVVCVEAGLALNAALVRVARELKPTCPVLGEEFDRVNQEIRAGSSRADALRALRERVPLEEVQSLVALLIQTDRMGTSIANALRVHSDTLRTKRRQRAEARARQATVKLIVPLVLFIFPELLVILLGPAMMSILDVLKDVSAR